MNYNKALSGDALFYSITHYIQIITLPPLENLMHNFISGETTLPSAMFKK